MYICHPPLLMQLRGPELSDVVGRRVRDVSDDEADHTGA